MIFLRTARKVLAPYLSTNWRKIPEFTSCMVSYFSTSLRANSMTVHCFQEVFRVALPLSSLIALLAKSMQYLASVFFATQHADTVWSVIFSLSTYVHVHVSHNVSSPCSDSVHTSWNGAGPIWDYGSTHFYTRSRQWPQPSCPGSWKVSVQCMCVVCMSGDNVNQGLCYESCSNCTCTWLLTIFVSFCINCAIDDSMCTFFYRVYFFLFCPPLPAVTSPLWASTLTPQSMYS